MSNPTKLDDAIRNYARKYHKYMQVETDIPPEIEEAKQAIKDLMLEIIKESSVEATKSNRSNFESILNKRISEL